MGGKTLSTLLFLNSKSKNKSMERVLLQDSKYFNKDIYKDTHPENVLTYTILTFNKKTLVFINHFI